MSFLALFFDCLRVRKGMVRVNALHGVHQQKCPYLECCIAFTDTFVLLAK